MFRRDETGVGDSVVDPGLEQQGQNMDAKVAPEREANRLNLKYQTTVIWFHLLALVLRQIWIRQKCK